MPQDGTGPLTFLTVAISTGKSSVLPRRTVGLPYIGQGIAGFIEAVHDSRKSGTCSM